VFNQHRGAPHVQHPHTHRSIRALAGITIAAAALVLAVGSPAAAADPDSGPDGPISVEPVDLGIIDVNDLIDWGPPPPKSELQHGTGIMCANGEQIPYVVNKSTESILVELIVDGVSVGSKAAVAGGAAAWTLTLAENSSADIDFRVNHEPMFSDWLTVDCLATDLSLDVTVDCSARTATYAFTNAGADTAVARILDNEGLQIDVTVAVKGTR